jgi:hypothetical protein
MNPYLPPSRLTAKETRRPAAPSRRAARFRAWLALALMFGLPLGAGQMLPMSLEELATDADMVVHGTVESLSCREGTSGRLVTRVELKLEATWKGASADSLTIVLAGGTLGNRREVLTGQAEYKPGEEVVLFLKRNPAGEPVTMALAQGKFAVRTDAAGRKHAFNPFHGQPASPPTGASRLERTGAAPLTLERLKLTVQGGLQ